MNPMQISRYAVAKKEQRRIERGEVVILDSKHATQRMANEMLALWSRLTQKTCKWQGSDIVAYDKKAKVWEIVCRGF